MQLFVSPSSIINRFGSFPDFQKACGFKPLKGEHRNFTKDNAIEYYKQLSEELGRPAGIKDIRERSKERRGPSPPTLLKGFDQKIQELKTAAGYEIKGRGTGDSWSATKSIEYYQQLSSELGHPATVEEIYAASKAGKGPSTTLLTKDFNGKISNLKAAAGLGKRQ